MMKVFTAKELVEEYRNSRTSEEYIKSLPNKMHKAPWTYTKQENGVYYDMNQKEQSRKHSQMTFEQLVSAGYKAIN